MSRLSQAATDYLDLRKRLGHDLAEHHRLLPRFVAYLDHIGAPTVTINAAMDWALAPEVDAATSNPARRMTIARRFAQHMAGLDPRTEVPPPGLISFPQRWHPPFIYTRTDLETLTTQARRQVQGRLPAATHSTMLGLLGATGLRVGEAIRLDRTDIDWTDQALLIRESKFGKSRLVPILPSTVTALRDYADIRDEHHLNAATASFFVSRRGARMVYPCVHAIFRKLCHTNGIGAEAPRPPRIHDLRHSFAVNTLLRWHRTGEDVEAKLPTLSTYLGHRDPRSTYWYLSAAPELLSLAAQRLEYSVQARPS
ncbi:tyrosine-type recombinase/integrase [Nocardia vinacea]|uniref:tyrosine-type recombinase/integrase n=1 Tax=Nocardia vinacea TaxID=96468 RepID=UPI002E1420B9|nr:tyrosine-type recombinase/integrase [Nocardia vinacea]WSF95359.1 tyrosine-type recombinase/integrase [Nocardia vinacea]